jgi:hypothetical protein
MRRQEHGVDRTGTHKIDCLCFPYSQLQLLAVAEIYIAQIHSLVLSENHNPNTLLCKTTKRMSTTTTTHYTNNNTARPSAELRPRSHIVDTSRRNHSRRRRESPELPSLDDAVIMYISMYRNMRPAYQYVNSRGTLCNIYHVLFPRSGSGVGGSARDQFLPRFFFHPETNNVCDIRISNELVRLATIADEYQFNFPRGRPLPETEELYIVIPRLFYADTNISIESESPSRGIPRVSLISNTSTTTTTTTTTTFTYDDTSSPVNTRTTTCSDVAFTCEDESSQVNIQTPTRVPRFGVCAFRGSCAIHGMRHEEHVVDECGICYTTKSREEHVNLQCGHSLCCECVKRTIQAEKTLRQSRGCMRCPFCRESTTDIYAHTEAVRDEMCEFLKKYE